jgi:uncharacterized protein DUF4190/uncharacterized protein DUF4339
MLYIGRNNQQLGPFSEDEVRQKLAAGELSLTDLAWREGMANWQPVASALGIVPAVPPPMLSAIPQPYVAPRPTSALAIWSFALGLASFGFYFLTAIPAIVCGHLALAQIRRSGGRLGGEGLAITGLIFGYFFVAILVVILLFFFAMLAITAGIAAGHSP